MACPMFCVCDKCSSRIASKHRAGDERFGRDWRNSKGCGCAACRLLRKNLDEIDTSFERIAKLQAQLAAVRLAKAVTKEVP